MAIHSTAIVDPAAELGRHVSIGPFSIIHRAAKIGDGSTIGSHCVIGYGESDDDDPVEIGSGATIRSHSVLYCGSSFGPLLQTGHSVTIREGTRAGTNLRIGTLSDIEGHCSIGDYARFHSNVHIGQQSTIGDFVWIFPFVVLTNDPHPPSNTMIGVTVEDFAAIGTMSVVVPGVTIGHDSLVAAGAVVTADVRAGSIAAGVPAKDRGDASNIRLSGTDEPAYPWRQHFRRGYPKDITDTWNVD